MKTLTADKIYQLIAIRAGVAPERMQYTYDRASQESTVIGICYERARTMLLEEHDWDFATKTAPLQFNVSQNSYVLPPDCIRAICIGGSKTGWRLEERRVLLGESTCGCGCSPCCCKIDTCCPIEIRYIFDQRNISKFTEHFVQAVARYAASLAGKSLTGSIAFEDRERVLAEKDLGRARAFQNQQAGGVKVIRPKARGGMGCGCN